MEHTEQDQLIKQAEEALLKAKVRLMYNIEWVFFSTVCMSLEHIITREVATAATDGKCVMYNPEFFLAQTQEQQVGLMLHEIMHVVFQHMFRRNDLEEKDYGKWNVAGDYVINLELVKSRAQLPEGALLDKKYADMTTEEVFAMLPDDPPEMNAPGFMEDIQGPAENATESEINEMQRTIDDILIQADMQAKAAKKAGSVPASVQRYLKELLNPIVPWQQVLKNFMTRAAKVDWTFRKPNRRYFPDHLLPSLSGEAVCDIAVMVDVSGSVGDHEFAVFLSEIKSVIKLMRPTKTTVVQFNSQIIQENILHTHQDLVHVDFRGGGGTRIDPVMDWAIENRPNVLIVITDGYYAPPTKKPKCPVLWVVFDNNSFEAPFGRHVPFSLPKVR